MRTIKAGGVSCKSDMGLYGAYNSNYIYFLSIYGSPQQVKAIFSLLALGREILLIKDEEVISPLRREFWSNFRFKSFSLGYGKRHGLAWSEGIGKDIIMWTSPEERLNALYSAISKRRIPFDRQWLPNIEALMLENNYLEELKGWGGAGGYNCKWDDDAICDLIAEEMLKDKGAVAESSEAVLA
jgi:hypothetical protein